MALSTRFYFLLAFNLLILLSCHAQNLKKALKVANSLYEEEAYKEALPAYLEVLKIEPGSAEANYKAGILYLRTIHKIKSLPYLKKAFETNPAIANDIKLQLATSYQFNHKYTEALKLFKEHKLSLTTKDPSKLKVIDRRIFECENGLYYLANPVKAQVDNIGSIVNSKYADFAPVITADESIMVFTSRRPGSTGEKLDENSSYYEDVYITYFKDGHWVTPKNIGKPVNNDGHDASIAISPDGTQLFIYKDLNMGDIFVSKMTGGTWSKPEDMGRHINTKHSETSISMTSDGRAVYFTSDREGGFGGFDIYKSEKDKKGKWGPAVNLGKVINTDYAEESPFIHPDGKTLYFSSRGHAGMGDYDIFKSTLKDDGSWSPPENLGYPINTADDDIYFVLSADNRNGYYSSERENGLGEKDIYLISMPKPVEAIAIETKTSVAPMPGLKEIAPIATVASFNPITILKGTVRDAITKQYLAAELTLTDNEKNEVISEITSNPDNGSFLIVLPSGKNYGLTIQKAGYLFHSENFDIPSSNNYQEVNKDIELKKVEVGSKIVLRNIFFDFDKSTLRPASTAELDRLVKLMVDMPKLKIEISGHTDNKGSSEYNKQLSRSRSESVVNYLIGHGIQKGRLTFAGYGFDRPVATNETNEGRQLNRRTEFEVMAD
ncbi:MAG TPA: OmpA family protein [Cytophagaceae bacterium]|jgi:outer membrane protein OmpA-like peptidoglycan-associated protein